MENIVNTKEARNHGIDMLNMLKTAIICGDNREFCCPLGGDEERDWYTLCGLGLAAEGGCTREHTHKYFFVSDEGLKLLKSKGHVKY